MEFGLLLHTRHLIRSDGKPPSFEEMWDEAVQAEDFGFDHVWVGDSVTLLEKARGDCLTVMASLAMKTRRLKVGTVPLLPALRPPVLLAHALATLDVISNGRIILGVSVGPLAPYIERQFMACGVAYHEKAGRLTESIELTRRLWTEDKVTFEGKYYRLEGVGILPKPIQKPTIPIWIAADRSEAAFRRVARLGDGWVTTAPTLEKFVQDRRKIGTHADAFGRQGWEIPSMLYATFNLNEDGARAREEGWRWMEAFFREPRSKLAHHFVIFGAPTECAQLLRGYADAGLSTIVARLASPNPSEQMRLIIEQLKPQLSARQQASNRLSDP